MVSLAKAHVMAWSLLRLKVVRIGASDLVPGQMSLPHGFGRLSMSLYEVLEPVLIEMALIIGHHSRRCHSLSYPRYCRLQSRGGERSCKISVATVVRP